MKYTSIKKWALSILLTLITVSVVSCLGIKAQVNQQRGANTELVNPSIFKIVESPLAIKNVGVLSTDCTAILDSLTVLVKNGKIVSIAKDVSITKEYKIVDGTGRFLIPGLIDSHAHLHKSKNDLLLYLANGVTHITNNNSESDQRILKWRQEAEQGSLSPKIYIAAGGMSTKKGIIQKIKTLFFGDSPKYNTPAQGRKAVKKFKSQGYDALKMYNLNREVYLAVADEAKKQNIPLIGHLPIEVGLERLYTSGQSQLAHVEEIIKNTIEDFGGLNVDNAEEYMAYLKKNSNDIASKLKKKNITVSSTIWIIESIPKQKFGIESFLKTIKLEYQNPGQIEGSILSKGWLPGNNSYENLEIKNNPEKIKKSKVFWKTYVEANHIMTKALVDNGVILTAGTDSNTAGVIAGFSLHDELESLSKIGLSNAQVLRSATLASAELMQSDAGKIEVGARADLVLLEKNPLVDINNTRTINAIVTNGKFLDRTVLDKILQSIKEANNRSRRTNIDEFIAN